MRARLKKDIIIPSGTIFDDACNMTVSYGTGMVSHIFGLTDDSSGEVFYGAGDGLGGLDDERLAEWFEVIHDGDASHRSSKG